jgi:putative ABC transport system permease protein
MRLEHWFYTLPLRLRSLFRRRRADQDLNDELQYHLEQKIEEYIAQGVTRGEARQAALRAMDGLAQRKEECRDVRGVNAVEDTLRDIRYSWRVLLKSPGFTTVAVLTLALGIGASTAIFSVVDAVLLRPLPYPHPEKIVRVWEETPRRHRISVADGNFQDFRAQNNTLADLAEYAYWTSSVSGGSEPARVDIAEVTGGFFESLGMKPFRGRAFAPEEQRVHGAPAAMVSYRYWQRYLGAATDLSIFHLTIDGSVYPVIGVMPEQFDFPLGVSAWIPREVAFDPGRTGHNWRVIGRVRDGLTVAQARADLSVIARRIRAQYGNKVDLSDAAVTTLADAMVGDVRAALLTLLGAVGLLLLVACTNVAGLLLARTSARRKELAVRAALGAGRGRLMQQFLAESFSLALTGGGLGILLAAWAVRALPAILPSNLPRQQGLAINAPVTLFALAAIVAVAVSLGLFAAWRAGRADLQEALTSGARGNTGSGSSERFRGFLVIGEIAMTLVILIGAGLLGRSFLQLISTSPGFRPQNLITMEFALPIPKGQWVMEQADMLRQIHLLEDMLARMRAIPGVETVGLAGAMPVAAGDDLAEGDFVILNGQKAPTNYEEFGRMARNRSQAGHAEYCTAGEQYFRTIGLPLIRGRMFSEQDDWNSPHVAVISEALARERWPQQDPIGQMIDFGNMDGNMKPLTIVGIVADVRARGLDLPPAAIIYVDYRQRGMNPNSAPTILVRSAAPAGEIVTAARGIFHGLAPDVPVKFSTFSNEMSGWLADRRFLLALVGVFAAAALSLAAIGIYGVVAFSVTRRTQEIGIRIALGADRAQVLRMVVGEGARLAVLGVVIGIAGSSMITRLLSSLLFGISATDPFTFAAVAALLSLVALLASYIPARRAMRLDPNTALRYE